MLDFDEKLNIVILGDSQVGKSTFIQNYINYDNDNEIKPHPQFGITNYNHIIEFNNKTILINFFEIISEDTNNYLLNSFYNVSHYLLLFFDLTNFSSFQTIDIYLQLLIDKQYPFKIVLIGNKTDQNLKIDTTLIQNKYPQFHFFFICSFNKQDIKTVFDFILKESFATKKVKNGIGFNILRFFTRSTEKHGKNVSNLSDDINSNYSNSNNDLKIVSSNEIKVKKKTSYCCCLCCCCNKKKKKNIEKVI